MQENVILKLHTPDAMDLLFLKLDAMNIHLYCYPSHDIGVHQENSILTFSA